MAPGYLSGGESSEGCQKSQERRRHETRPTRFRGAETVTRVTKPWRRTEAGEANPRVWILGSGKC
jgi:hypothetical protein